MFGLLRVDGCLLAQQRSRCIPLQFCGKALFGLSVLWVSCVAYLVDGKVWVLRFSFSSCVVLSAWDEQ